MTLTFDIKIIRRFHPLIMDNMCVMFALDHAHKFISILTHFDI